MNGCEFMRCALYKDGICTDEQEWVNKETGEPMCKLNSSAMPKVEYDSLFPASKEPCGYCKGFYEPYNFIWEYKTEKGDIRLHERVDTHYCPMCGRKLGEK